MDGEIAAQGRGAPVTGCSPRNPIMFTDVLALGTSRIFLFVVVVVIGGQTGVEEKICFMYSMFRS